MTEASHLNITKAVYDTPTGSVMVNTKHGKAVLQRYKSIVSTIYPVQYSTGSISQSTQATVENKRYVNRKEVKIIPICRYDSAYGKIIQRPHQSLFELTTEFSKMQKST